jgi:glycosyltransferase involved in cell wall biosynthesis
MIVFLNFAPIEFMGGAERWMLNIASKTNEKEETILMDVSKKIADFYGRLVLKREFKNNFEKTEIISPARISLRWTSFIPFTKNWLEVRNIFKNARIIYARYELPEILILFYFGGFKIFRKTIAGLHLSIIYESPVGWAHKLHNLIYNSWFYKTFLKRARIVHVINDHDEILLKDNFKLENVTKIYNGTKIPDNIPPTTSLPLNRLNVIFVGELSKRKGVDTLIEIIRQSPKYINFTVIGDGPLRSDIEKLIQSMTNLDYKGYVSDSELQTAYLQNDVLLFPSRAEAFGLVMIEAMANGLLVVNSREVSLNFPFFVERSIKDEDVRNYLQVLEELLSEKRNSKIDRSKIREYCELHFSEKMIVNQLYTMFNITRMLDKPKVDIGIAAYNAEKNIKSLLLSLIHQKEINFILNRIIVHSDQSSDGTVSFTRSVEDPRIELIESSSRLGFKGSSETLLLKSDADIIVLLNDDIKIFDSEFLFKIVEPFLGNSNVGLVCANCQPLTPINFLDRAIVSGFRAYDKIRYKLNNGINVHTVDGKVLAFSRTYKNKFSLDDHKNVGNLDTYLYFLALEKKFSYCNVREAVVYYRNPTNFIDYKNWFIRNFSNQFLLKKRFGNIVEKEYSFPKFQFLFYRLIEFLKNPIGSSFLLVMSYYISFKAKQYADSFSEIWTVVESTKNL